MANLLENAAQHAGGPVRIGVEGSGDRVRIVVEDAGPGVPAGREGPHLRALRPRVGRSPPRRHRPRPGPGRRARPPPRRRGLDRGPSGRRLPVHHRAPGRSRMTRLVSRRGRVRPPLAAVGALGAAALLAGCGMPPTSAYKPIDAGRPPVRSGRHHDHEHDHHHAAPGDHHDHDPADHDDGPDQRAGAGVLRRRQRAAARRAPGAPPRDAVRRAHPAAGRPGRDRPPACARRSPPAPSRPSTSAGGKATVDLAPGSLDQPGAGAALRVRADRGDPHPPARHRPGRVPAPRRQTAPSPWSTCCCGTGDERAVVSRDDYANLLPNGI